jgi:hypothetical protein
VTAATWKKCANYPVTALIVSEIDQQLPVDQAQNKNVSFFDSFFDECIRTESCDMRLCCRSNSRCEAKEREGRIQIVHEKKFALNRSSRSMCILYISLIEIKIE